MRASDGKITVKHQPLAFNCLPFFFAKQIVTRRELQKTAPILQVWKTFSAKALEKIEIKLYYNKGIFPHTKINEVQQ